MFTMNGWQLPSDSEIRFNLDTSSKTEENSLNSDGKRFAA
jgi:hypothetical protein